MSELPSGWLSLTLSEVVDIQKGKKPFDLGEKNATRQIPYINIAAFETGYIREYAVEQNIPKCEPKDTLLVWDGARAGLSGRGANGYIGSTLAKISSLYTNPDYLFYFFQSIYKILNTQTKGVGIPHIDPNILKNLKFPLPPLNEQNRIVAKLEELFSDLDAGISELNTAQAKLKQYRQSLLKAAVEGDLSRAWRESRPADAKEETGAQLLERILIERRKRWEEKQLAKFTEQGKQPPKDWQKKYPEPVKPDNTDLPKLPDGWVWASLDMLAYPIRNGVSPKPNTEKLGYPVLRISAVRSMSVNLEEIRHLEISDEQAREFVLNNDDILITRYNGSIDLLGVFGVVRGLKKSFIHPDKLIRAQPVLEQPLSDWIEISANTHHSRKYVVSKTKTTSGQTGVSGEDIKKTPIPLPPLAEQSEICKLVYESLQALEKQTQAIEHALAQSAAQRKNILRAAFAGELVAQDPNDESASVLLERIQAERQAQPKAKKTRPSRSKQELHVMPKTVLEALQEANDWVTGQELAKQYGIGDGASINTVEAFYAELRELELNNKLEVKPDSFGFKRQDKIRLKDKSDAA